jgi:hypothetical protein
VIFGGRNDDGAYDLAVSGGSVFIAGDSDSPDMGCSGDVAGDDAYLIKLGASGEVVFCKALGGLGTDSALGVAVEASGRGVIVGQTDSTVLCGVSGGYGGKDAFLAVLNSTGNAWEYITIIGGTGTDIARTVLLDRSQGIQVAGFTSSADFPISSDAQQSTLLGSSDGFIVRFVPAWTLNYGSYFGGSADDTILAMALDLWGYTYLSGSTHSDDFPVTSGAYDVALGGDEDAFIAKMGIGPTPGVVLRKYTNGFDANLPPGPSLQVGSAVQWRYDVTNTGATALSSVTVSDNRITTIQCPFTSLAAGASMT